MSSRLKINKQAIARATRSITLYEIKDGDTGQQVAEGLKSNFDQIVTQLSSDETILSEHTNSINALNESNTQTAATLVKKVSFYDVSAIFALTTESESDAISTVFNGVEGWNQLKTDIQSKILLIGYKTTENLLVYVNALINDNSITFSYTAQKKIWTIVITLTDSTFAVTSVTNEDIAIGAIPPQKKFVEVLANSGIIYDKNTYNSILPESYLSTYPFQEEYVNGFPWIWLNINNPEGNSFDLQIRKDGLFVEFSESSESIGTISDDEKTITLTVKNYFGFEIQKDLNITLDELNGLWEILITIDQETYRYYFYVNNFFQLGVAYNIVMNNANNYTITTQDGKNVFTINNGSNKILLGEEIEGSTTGSLTISDISDITTPIAFNQVSLATLITNIGAREGKRILTLEGTGNINAYSGTSYSLIQSGQLLNCVGAKAISITDTTDSLLQSVKLTSASLSSDKEVDIANGDKLLIRTIDPEYNLIKITLTAEATVKVNDTPLENSSLSYTYTITGEEESFAIEISPLA